MHRYKGILCLLALQFATATNATEGRTLCTQQADLVEFIMTVRADGFPRQGAEAELQKRYPTAPAGYWQQELPQYLLKFSYNTDGLKPVAAREYFFNLCLTEVTDIDTAATNTALFADAKDCQNQFDSDKTKVKACVEKTAEPVLLNAWNAKHKGAK